MVAIRTEAIEAERDYPDAARLDTLQAQREQRSSKLRELSLHDTVAAQRVLLGSAPQLRADLTAAALRTS